MILLLLLSADEWRFDVVHRKGLESLEGLILERTPERIKIRCIRRTPGKPTVFWTDAVPAAEIRRVEELTPEERKKLEARLETLRKEREALHALEQAIGKGTTPPADMVELADEDWPEEPKKRAQSYSSSHFKLYCRGRPELAQLAAVYLEQVYAAYSRAMPEKAKGEATTILLMPMADYIALLKARKLDLLAPAFYDPEKNQVACGSDLSRLMDDRDKVKAHHAKLGKEIRERRADLMKVYKGKPPASLLSPLKEAEARIIKSEQRNADVVAKARQRLFARLYHESFHAYLETCVYPGKGVPIWLNEGLAQVFESAIVEAGEMRIGHLDQDRMAAVRSFVSKKELPALNVLLRSTAKDFQAAHTSAKREADAHYLASWALAHYLAFDRRLLGTAKMDTFIAALSKDADPATAFRDLVGEPLAKFEESHRAWLARKP